MEFAKVRQGPLAVTLVRYEFTRGCPSLRHAPLPHHKLGLSYTASGYGAKVPTEWMVRTINQKWRRVYFIIYNNLGTLYIVQDKEKILVDIHA